MKMDRRVRSRRAVATIIATLIMIAVAAVFTSMLLYWGLSMQGQSLSNFGNAIFYSSNAAAEQISIDGVRFATVQTSPVATYSATVYVRNYGDNPVSLAGVHIENLQAGASVPAVNCEVTISSSKVVHPPIVARSMQPIDLDTPTGSISRSTPGCASPGGPVTFPSSWDGQSVSVQIATSAGTLYASNFALPTSSVAISSASFTVSPTSPSAVIVLSDVGNGYMNVNQIKLTGAASNTGFKGSVTVNIPASGSFTPSASDGSWTASPSSASAFQAVASGTNVVISLSATAASTGIQHGDQITVSATTAEGTSISALFSVP